MKIGSKQWRDKVEENYTFPCMIAIYYTSEKTFLTGVINTTSKNPKLVKYSSIRPPMLLNGEKTTLCGVYYVKSVDDYEASVLEAMKGFEEDVKE